MNASSPKGDEVRPSSNFLLPQMSLSNCVFGGFVRDTRGAALEPSQRYNRFAASPLCALGWVFDGEAHLIEGAETPANPASCPKMPRLSFSGPQQRPVTTWNPGDAHGMIVAIYPDALHTLTKVPVSALIDKTVSASDVLDASLLKCMEEVLEAKQAEQGFSQLCIFLDPIWQEVRPRGVAFMPMVQDWVRTIAVSAVLSPFGQSTRQKERRIRDWTGQSLRSLRNYGRNDQAFKEALMAKEDGDLDLADLSVKVGFSDQSHMSRNVRKQTGFPPSQLMKLIEEDESFWPYRLMGERY